MLVDYLPHVRTVYVLAESRRRLKQRVSHIPFTCTPEPGLVRSTEPLLTSTRYLGRQDSLHGLSKDIFALVYLFPIILFFTGKIFI